MKRSAQIGGRASKRTGDNFEKEIIRANTYYSSKEIAVIIKVPTGARAVGTRNGQAIWKATEKTGCDFLGNHRGQGVALETKTTNNKASFPITTHKKPTLLAHQLQFLKEFEATGGKSYILINLEGAGRTFNVPVYEYIKLTEKAQEAGRKSFKIEWINEEFEVFRNGYMIDYLKERTV